MQLPCFVNQTMAPACGKRLRLRSDAAAMTVIEIRPQHWGWKVFEAPGVEPVFPEKGQAIDYAFRSKRRSEHC
jgi:hypothetical protein